MKDVTRINLKNKTYDELCDVRHVKKLKTYDNTVKHLLDNQMPENVREMVADTQSNVRAINKKFEERGSIIDGLLDCMKNNGIVQIDETLFYEIPQELIRSAEERGIYFVKSKNVRVDHSPIAQKIPVEISDIVNEDVE